MSAGSFCVDKCWSVVMHLLTIKQTISEHGTRIVFLAFGNSPPSPSYSASPPDRGSASSPSGLSPPLQSSPPPPCCSSASASPSAPPSGYPGPSSSPGGPSP